MRPIARWMPWILWAVPAAALSFMWVSLAAAPAANAAEIIPAIGLSKPVEGDGDVKAYASLALRGQLIPLVKSEIGVAYRSEERHDGALDVHQWPITASLWFTPVRTIYAGAGVGLYHTTFDYEDELSIEDDTKSEFGVHLGGGLALPLSERLALDVNGRYVMLRDQDDKLVPDEFDPDFWTTTLGLAIEF
jgi:hypothetical protein